MGRPGVDKGCALGVRGSNYSHGGRVRRQHYPAITLQSGRSPANDGIGGRERGTGPLVMVQGNEEFRVLRSPLLSTTFIRKNPIVLIGVFTVIDGFSGFFMAFDGKRSRLPVGVPAKFFTVNLTCPFLNDRKTQVKYCDLPALSSETVELNHTSARSLDVWNKELIFCYLQHRWS